MQKGLVIRVAVSVVVLACFAYSLLDSLHPDGQLPFSMQPSGPTTLTIAPKEGADLPPGVQAGDTFDWSQNLATRMLAYSNVRAGESYSLQLERDGEMVTARVTLTEADGPAIGAAIGAAISAYSFWALTLILGLVTLWWGRSWAAWGFSLYGNLMVVQMTLSQPLPLVTAFVTSRVVDMVVSPLGFAGLYISAWALVGAGVPARVRRWHHGVFALVLVFYLALHSYSTGIVLANWPLPPSLLRSLTSIPLAIWILMPLEVLLLGYRRADAAQRSNLRWLIWSFLLLIGSAVAPRVFAALQVDMSAGLRSAVIGIGMALGTAGLLYGLLIRRVIPLSFFVHRGLVYGLTITMVVVVFAAMEALLQETTLGDNASLMVSVAVSLVLGLTLDQIHRRIGAAIERLLFRRKHAAVSSLREFARHSAFMEDRARLLDDAVALIATHMQIDAVAIYDRTPDGYQCIRQHGTDFPERTGVDDRAFVALRAGASRVSLDELESALGRDGRVFPMAVRGVLQGALVCGPRIERYTVDELNLLATVAHQVGVAYYALQSRDGDSLLKALASGKVEAHAARESARKVLNLSAHGNASV